MLSVVEAKKIIIANSTALTAVNLPLKEASGKVLASDLFAPIDIPGYPQSGMDGYAFSYARYEPGRPMEIVGEVAAGEKMGIEVPPGKAVRIFTGAPVPATTDTVVMQEKTKRTGDLLEITATDVKAGANVRPGGSEIRQGSLALPKGTRLKAASVGFLAGMGLTSAFVYPHPSIALIVTGNELQQPGESLAYGQVYESNSIAIQAALQELGMQLTSIIQVHDSLEHLSEVLALAIEQHDLVLLTGGVSVGDYDFTLAAAANCGLETLFHKLKQKPGKPLYVGKKGKKLVFGLPGNPASVLTCFYQYVTEALSIQTQKKLMPPVLQVPAINNYHKPTGLTVFLKGYYQGEQVTVLTAQESYKLNSYALANCLIEVPENSEGFNAGELVTIHLLH